jgi:hypothetical protein
MPRQQAPVPAAITRRRRLVQCRQDPLLVLGLVMGGLAAARRIRQTSQCRPGKAATLFADVAGRTPTRAATAALLSPSATPRITAARNARRRSVLPAASHDRSLARSSLVNTTSAAFIAAKY